MLRRALIIAVGLVIGAGAAQGPEFIQQYTQRLGGWRDAYAKMLGDLDKRAAEAGVGRDAYVAALRGSEDRNAVREGDYLVLLPGYLAALQTAYKELDTAPPWSRAVVFVKHFNYDLTKEVLLVYKPAVPTTVEGAAYGGVGFLVGWLAVSLAGMPYRIWQERRFAAANRRKLY